MKIIPIVLLIGFNTVFGDYRIFVSDTPGTLLIEGPAGPIAEMSWKENAVVGPNDSITVIVGTEYEYPPNLLGENVPLNLSITFKLDNLSELVLGPGKLKISFLNNDAHYTYPQIEPSLDPVAKSSAVFKGRAGSSEFSVIESTFPTLSYRKNLYPDTLASDVKYLLAAHNVLKGEVGPVAGLDSIRFPYFVPHGERAVLLSGLPKFSIITVYGTLSGGGAVGDSLSIRTLRFMNNDPDSTGTLSMKYLKIDTLGVDRGRAKIEHSKIGNIQNVNGAVLHVKNAKVVSLNNYSSKAYFIECTLGLSGPIQNFESFFVVKKSELHFLHGLTCDWQRSFIHLDSNNIFAFTHANTTCSYDLDAVVIAEHNIFTSIGTGVGGVGLPIQAGSFGLIRYNLFKGYNVSVQTGDESFSVIHNNTFIFDQHGIQNKGTRASLSISNNIFYNHGSSTITAPTDLEDSHSNTGSKVNYDNNLSFFLNATNNWGGKLFDYKGGATVIGDTLGISGDPGFKDTLTYSISEFSPAIDSGAVDITGLEFQATILDTVLKLPKGFRITNYNGAAPDLGAFEFGGRDPGIVTAIRSGKVRESKAITIIKDRGKIRISFNTPFEGNLDPFLHLDIYNMLGVKVGSANLNKIGLGSPPIYEVELSNLKSGVHFFLLNTPLGNWVKAARVN